jgi:hypothetical protein
MSPRIVIAALTIAVMGAVSPSFAQTPENSPAALASPQAKSETATGPADSSKTGGTARTFTAERSTNDAGSGKTQAQPSAKK